VFSAAELHEIGGAAWDKAKDLIGEMGKPEAEEETDYLNEGLRSMFGPSAAVMEWSVGWVQGDGVTFRVDIDDLPAFTQGDDWNGAPVFPKDDPALAGVTSVSVDGGDLRGWGRGPSVTVGWGDFDDSNMTYTELVAQDEAAESVVLDWYRDMATYLYDLARKDFEYWWGDEACLEYAKDMGLEFFEDGSLAS